MRHEDGDPTELAHELDAFEAERNHFASRRSAWFYRTSRLIPVAFMLVLLIAVSSLRFAAPIAAFLALVSFPTVIGCLVAGLRARGNERRVDALLDKRFSEVSLEYIRDVPLPHSCIVGDHVLLRTSPAELEGALIGGRIRAALPRIGFFLGGVGALACGATLAAMHPWPSASGQWGSPEIETIGYMFIAVVMGGFALNHSWAPVPFGWRMSDGQLTVHRTRLGIRTLLSHWPPDELVRFGQRAGVVEVSLKHAGEMPLLQPGSLLLGEKTADLGLPRGRLQRHAAITAWQAQRLASELARMRDNAR
jgi:hypothetical protein